jgi:predicted nucleic acid-binding protein
MSSSISTTSPNPRKQLQARLIFRGIAGVGAGAVSTQVLSEFFSVTTRRLRPRLPFDLALRELERHARVWNVLPVTGPVIIAAARAVRDHELSFRDAQLWAAAKINQVDITSLRISGPVATYSANAGSGAIK